MSYLDEILADEPVLYWRMQEASGLPQDSSGTGNHATVATGTAQYDVAGPILSDPSDDAIFVDADSGFSAPDHASLDLGDVFTLEAWVKRQDSTTTEHNIITKDTNGYMLGILDNQVFLARPGVALIAESSITITDTDTWHHLVATKDGATSKIYVDGEDVTSLGTNSTITNTTSALFIGHGHAANRHLVSHLDEVAVYPTALSGARILAHYEASFEEEEEIVPGPKLRIITTNQRW